ncbi:sugar kinase [Streptomyces sp. NPDC006289]|uniref:sugar kinase n=1 Tax=Streptomyces sp. NPDC006289 TaxID=3156744 RepID=UPI0033A52979
MTDLPADAVCIGESMAMLVPEDASPITDRSRFVVRVGGAESNVAVSLARLGHRSRWVSALGADPFGRIVLDDVAGAGVDTSFVVTDDAAPTGIYAKDPQGPSTRVHYYRRGSAASRMDVTGIDPAAAEGAGVVHLSGTTPALSESCRRLTRAVVADRALGTATVSFDVNYRPGLWSVAEAAGELAAIARRADIVFVGRDEAATLWGTDTAEDVRDLLPEPAVLVVKDGATGASVHGPDGTTWADALRVPVVETVGAGDAFAAGWLSAWLRGLGPECSLRLGHLVASRAVQIVGDCPEVPPRDEIDRYLGLQEERA